MLFKFKIEKSEALKKIVGVIKTISNDITLKVTQYGVVATSFDETKNSMVYIDLTAHEIKLEGEEQVVSLDIDRFYKILTNVEGVYSIECETMDKLRLYNETNAYSVSLIDCVGTQTVPDMVFTTMCMIPSNVLSSGIKSSLNINDMASLSSDMVLTSVNEHSGSSILLKQNFVSGDNLQKDLTKQQLVCINKFCKVTKSINIGFGEDLPLRTVYVSDIGSITLYIH